ncbi:transcriptional regulator FlhC [Thauera propionica]|jgi:flagellar transcriptional activator FlhC|uniref:Flagellar transcriptional regulator FlhC n=1 Tax=Thauera propionica TaxID=2019431 RepID=A0A235EX60_9RHOO|nr:flagellar transcriptional regulator FlhC [Thauera propionica]MDD3675731.1 flagellar transcriptional regulator FlhC [Thauera propionica]OYD53594.1 transcriptional regulator FlhC [Thauera propionica]
MKNKSVIEEADDIRRAVEMVQLGARMQMLEVETRLSREKLLKIYKEVRGVSPPKGMLPFSTDWFMTWQPNVHSSLFMALHRFYCERAGIAGLDAIIKAYHLYLDHIESNVMEPVLSLTRAWTLVRFFDADLLQMTPCKTCGGHFVAHAHDPAHDYVCGLCNMPSRAGKSRRTTQARPATRRKSAAATA